MALAEHLKAGVEVLGECRLNSSVVLLVDLRYLCVDAPGHLSRHNGNKAVRREHRIGLNNASYGKVGDLSSVGNIYVGHQLVKSQKGSYLVDSLLAAGVELELLLAAEKSLTSFQSIDKVILSPLYRGKTEGPALDGLGACEILVSVAELSKMSVPCRRYVSESAEQIESDSCRRAEGAVRPGPCPGDPGGVGWCVFSYRLQQPVF